MLGAGKQQVLFCGVKFLIFKTLNNLIIIMINQGSENETKNADQQGRAARTNCA